MSKDPSIRRPTSVIASDQASSLPRFGLRKRFVRNGQDVTNLSSYNSEFLSGLFADVAQANDCTDSRVPHKRSADHDSPCDLTTVSPTKKSRVSLSHSLSRVGASSTTLSRLVDLRSPKGINEFFGSVPRTLLSKKSLAKNHHQDSLAFQLNCVSGSDDLHAVPTNTSSPVGAAARFVFPNLPATVSDSSCETGLTRAKLVRHAPIPENGIKDIKETFGWFVDLDDHQSREPQERLPYNVSSDNLAFKAPTAPKRVNNDAEVEWAKAADTVDDVLGAFF